MMKGFTHKLLKTGKLNLSSRSQLRTMNVHLALSLFSVKPGKVLDWVVHILKIQSIERKEVSSWLKDAVKAKKVNVLSQ